VLGDLQNLGNTDALDRFLRRSMDGFDLRPRQVEQLDEFLDGNVDAHQLLQPAQTDFHTGALN
jgi:hypothetical protein